MSEPAKKRKTPDIAELRRRAEDKLRERENMAEYAYGMEIKDLIHELGTYQIKLEMQNEELRRAQEMIEESRQRYADLYNFAPVGLLLIDRAGYIKRMNTTALSMLKVNRWAKLLVSSYLLPEERPRFRNHLMGVLSKKDKAIVEMRMKRDDGSEFIGQFKSIAFEEDGALYLRTAIIDVTELRNAEEARRKAEENERAARDEAALLRTQRLESLNAMVGGIAHDLNNLMVAVEANTEIALRDLNPDSPAWEAVNGIEKAVGKVSNLSKQILSFSGKTKDSKEAVDINTVARDTVHLLLATLHPGTMLESSLGRNIPLIKADPQNVQQVLMNLIINASDAIGDKGGTIRIFTGESSVSRDYLDNIMLGKEAREGRHVFIEVTDTGSGMNRDTVRRVFEPFFSTKFTGRGLGLAAVLNIVKSHNGAIELSSAIGEGTGFKVFFPVPEEELEIKEERKPEKKIWSGKGTVLVADDDESALLIAGKILSMAGYKVLTATDGPEAISIFETHKDEIDLVVMDYIMPRMRGSEATAQMRSLKENVNVILLSGYYDIDVRDISGGSGKTFILEKPYKIEKFLQKVHEALEHRMV